MLGLDVFAVVLAGRRDLLRPIPPTSVTCVTS
jgi:hypothetical protein